MKDFYWKCACTLKNKDELIKRFWPWKKNYMYPKIATINNYTICISVEELNKFCIHDRTILRTWIKDDRKIGVLRYILY